MTRPLLDRQDELPRSVHLFRYLPVRGGVSVKELDPSRLRSSADLPARLILGDLDPSTFKCSEDGWSARWQGTEADTFFEVTYEAVKGRWLLGQTWCGINGGFSVFPARISLDKVIAQGLCRQFPRSWDEAARSQIESAYQVSVVTQSEEAISFCGIPDGAFRTIIIPVAVRHMRIVQEWLQDLLERSPLSYPLTVEARRIFQAVNYIEGKAPEWTKHQAVVFCQSVTDSGLAPRGMPVREEASDGSAAWTLRRDIYCLFIGLPFAGLIDFLSRMRSCDGPIRGLKDPVLRAELRPVVVPAGFEVQAERLTLWDKDRTTRSQLYFQEPGQRATVPSLDQMVDSLGHGPALLENIEAISDGIVEAIDQSIRSETKGATA